MLNQLADAFVLLGFRVCVETEISISMFNSSVKRPAVGSETQAQQVAII